jgi:hypothetical protein
MVRSPSLTVRGQGRPKESVGTVTEARRRVGDPSRRAFAASRGERVELHPACRGRAERSPRPVPAGPLPGRIAEVVSH